jgi:hypothetical protein
MKNIKTFKQLFESLIEDRKLKIVSFGVGEHKEFSEYCTDKELTNWDPIRWPNTYEQWTKTYGKFYIINDEFLVMFEGETPSKIRLIQLSDIHNNHSSKTDAIESVLLNKIGCSLDFLKMCLSIARKIPYFIFNIDSDLKSDNEIDFLCEYFKKNPLEIYLLDDSPELKKEVLDKTGIKDYGDIGRKLKQGLI